MARWLTSMLSILILSLIIPTSFTAESDINGHPFEKQIRALDVAGVMKGDGKGNYFPEKEVTRAQFAAFLARALQLPNGNQGFLDTVKHPLSYEVSRAASVGLIGGIGDNRFAPDEPITREQMAVIADRALRTKGVYRSEKPLSVSDLSEIRYPAPVQSLVGMGVISIFPDHTFRPKEKVTRAETAKTIYNMLQEIKKVEKWQKQQQQLPSRSKPYTPVSSIIGNVAVAQAVVTIFKEDMKGSATYVSPGTEMKVLKAEPNRIQVQVADTVGYVKPEEVQMLSKAEGQSYYKMEGKELYHYIYRNGQYEKYLYGPAPVFMREGNQEPSIDGKTFGKGVAYHYFNYLPLHTETIYTAEQLDEYIVSQRPDSPLIGLGATFKKAEAQIGVNALYLLAHAIHESAWGFSKVATEKFNLYGIQATDDNPLENATGFTSFEESVMYAANYVKTKYLTPGERTFYHGAFLGNKSVGMNVYYASDPYWGQKIAGHMYRADKYLGGLDWGRHRLAASLVDPLNIRSGPSTSEKLQYKMNKVGISMIVIDEWPMDDGVWLELKSDHPEYERAFVYGDGKLGHFVEKMK